MSQAPNARHTYKIFPPSLRNLAWLRWWLSGQPCSFGQTSFTSIKVEQRPSWQVLSRHSANSGAGSCQDSLLPHPLSVLVIPLMTVIYRCNAFLMASWVGRRPILSQHGWVDWLFNHPVSSTTHTPTLLEYIEAHSPGYI